MALHSANEQGASVLFRTDASVVIGGGHVQRCLTLAHQLHESGHSVCFACRDPDGMAVSMIRTSGFPCHVIAADSTSQEADAAATLQVIGERSYDWLVVDHYGLDAVWEQIVRSHACHILVIDDLANRPHDCDLLLDQNYYVDATLRYHDLVPKNTTLLLGPAYALLRKEFQPFRTRKPPRDGHVRRVLLFFGSSDPTGETLKAMDAFSDVTDLAFDVVIGASNPDRDHIAALCDARGQFTFHCQIDYVARLMAAADLAIGAGGSTMWERCLMGLPCLTIVTADNQAATTRDVATAGALQYLGRHEDVTATDYRTGLQALRQSPDTMRALSACARALVVTVSDTILDAMRTHSRKCGDVE